MEQMSGARLFLRVLRVKACDGVSVRVRIRCCLFSITLAFGVCCITWFVEQIIEVISPPTEVVFDIGESRTVVCCTVVGWLFRPSFHVRSSRETVR